MLLKRILPTAIFLAIMATVFAACGDDAGSARDATASPAPTHTGAPGSPTPLPRVGPTGIEAVDRAIRALGARDAEAFTALLLFAPERCAAPGQGSGGPPDCEPGGAVGTPVDVLPAASCEGYWMREPEAQAGLRPLFDAPPQLVGVYRTEQRLFNRAGTYAVIVDLPVSGGPRGANIIMTPDGVAGIDFGCGESGAELIERAGVMDPVYLPGGALLYEGQVTPTS